MKWVTVSAASLVLAFAAVMTSFSHEKDDVEEDLPPGGSSGPALSDPVAMPSGLTSLEISLGEPGAALASWEGDVEVASGKLVELEVIRGGANAEVNEGHFRLMTAPQKKKAGANAKKAVDKKQQTAKAKAKAKNAEKAAQKKDQVANRAILRATIEGPPTAEVTVNTNRGEFRFTTAEVTSTRPKAFLEGRATVERQIAGVRLTGSAYEDDYPSAAKGPDGGAWLVYVEYKPEQPRAHLGGEGATIDFDTLVPKRNGDRIRLRKFDGKTWLPSIPVTDGGLDVWRPTVAVDRKGVVWVAWAQAVDGNWEIFRRGYTPPGSKGGDGTWGSTVRVTNAAGSDFHVVATTDSEGTVWLAWQAWRGNNYEILAAAQREGHPWSTPRVISESEANDWGPTITSDTKGNVYVAWDTYDKGNYDVRLRAIGKENAPARTIAGSARFEGRPHITCDPAGRVWIAYEEGDEQWGKDYAHAGPVGNVGLEKNPGNALYVGRTIRVKCLEDGRLLQPSASLETAFDERLPRNKSVPRVTIAGDGSLWMVFRHAPIPFGPGEVWVGYAMRYEGAAWSAPRRLGPSTNLIDNRPALVPIKDGVLTVYSSDSRANTAARGQDDLFSSILVPDRAASNAPELIGDSAPPDPTLETVHPNEPADVARVRAYRIDTGGKSLKLLRGEFHRHTEFSSHNDQDGLLEDAWRYALDAGRLDWMGDGDHDNGFGHEYMWWLIQKNADLHHNLPHFIPAQTYERSVVFPNGHRNVMMPKRGIRPLPRGNFEGTAESGTPDTKRLYEYLKHFGGICASHTSATDMGTDWRDNDPSVEPVVEVYQGHRHNYETPGAPRSPTEATQIGGFQPKGFIWNALGKGYRLGFQSSSDHISTHISYAVVLAEDVSRQGVLDAFKKRRCYAATDNIVLDVRSGDHLMGEAFETTARPSIKIVAQGTGPIDRVDVVRDNAYIFSSEPKTREITLNYTDDEIQPGQSHYYYVRIRQADGNLAWGSPMWITYAK